MLRTAAAFAALSLSAGLCISSGTALADAARDADNTPVVVAHNAASDDNAATVRITDQKPADASLVNRRNGKTITLEMVKNDVEWREETAHMLQRDRTFQEPR